MQVPVPEHAPLQPKKTEPDAGEAVKVTFVPCAKVAEHTLPQLMPPVSLVTVPLPPPVLLTVRVTGVLVGVLVAVAVLVGVFVGVFVGVLVDVGV
jgi:hypothetical protein